jgi:hypothetical protein
MPAGVVASSPMHWRDLRRVGARKDSSMHPPVWDASAKRVRRRLSSVAANGRYATGALSSPRSYACRRSVPLSVTRSSSPVCTPAISSEVTTLGWTTTVMPLA